MCASVSISISISVFMRIGTIGIVIDQFGQLLLIRRNDTRTWTPPGGALDRNESPLDGVVREVEEETGIKAIPVRLAGLYFWPMSPSGFLSFVFRCLPSGGELTPSPESPELAYVPSNALPFPMLNVSRQRIEGALTHVEERPLLITQPFTLLERLGMFILRKGIYAHYNRQRKRAENDFYIPPVKWATSAFAVIQNEDGAVLWIMPTDEGEWRLPGGGGEKMEPPWETAVRETYKKTGLSITIKGLTGVYQSDGRDRVDFVFTAAIQNGTARANREAAQLGWFMAGDEPKNRHQAHLERAADALSPSAITIFKKESIEQ